MSALDAALKALEHRADMLPSRQEVLARQMLQPDKPPRPRSAAELRALVRELQRTLH